MINTKIGADDVCLSETISVLEIFRFLSDVNYT